MSELLRSLIASVCVFVAVAVLGVSSASAATVPEWPAASEFNSYPSNAITPTSDQIASIDQVSCVSRGDCVSAGYYLDSSDDYEPTVATESAGVWGQASALTQPSGTSSGYSWLASVNCTSVGNCVAGGQYEDTSDNDLAMVAAESAGVWGQAQEVSLPLDADTTAGTQRAVVESVDCTSQGNCVAGGEYVDMSGDYHPMVATETGGVWARAQDVSLPSGGTSTTNSDEAVFSVSCTSEGNCVAGGEYIDTSGDHQAMVATESGGVWGQASELSLPSNSNTTVGDESAAVYAVSCTSEGNCVAGGYYTDMNGTNDNQAMAATETGGVWGRASELALPTGANTTASAQDAEVFSVDCTSQGNCVASGYYTDTNGSGDHQAMVATETGGAWGQASKLALPSNENTTASDQLAGLYTLSCVSPGYCVGGGQYKDSSGGEQELVVSSVGSLSVGSGLPVARVGVPYSAQLPVTGGAGSYSSAKVSGSLPAGLSLSSSGVVSGTPKLVGTSTFGVVVSDPGPPAQQASGSVSFTVAKHALVTKVVKFGDQKLSLTTPFPLACVAKPGKLAVKFNSARRSTGAKLKFLRASFFVDKGVKHKVHKTVRGKRKLVTVYVANATKKHVPMSLHLSMAGMKAGKHTLKVVVYYKKTVDHHTVTVSKTLRVKFTVC